jgi:hypothetical protein
MIDLTTGRHETKYMTFIRETSPKSSRPCWLVRNSHHGEILGTLDYYAGWRQYVFAPRAGCDFNNSCLTEIVNVLTALNATPAKATA